VIGKIGTPERLDVEKTQSAGPKPDRPRQQLTIPKQVNLILPDMIRPQTIWQAMKVFGEICHRVEIAMCGALGIVATLEFIQHQLPKMSHGKPPVTRGFHSQQSQGKAHAAATVASATKFKRRGDLHPISYVPLATGERYVAVSRIESGQHRG